MSMERTLKTRQGWFIHGAVGCWLVLVCHLAMGQPANQGGVLSSDKQAGIVWASNSSASMAEALRERVVKEEWVRVRVTLRSPLDTPALATEADLETRQAHLAWLEEDLLFSLPEGSYEAVERALEASQLTLRVTKAGLDEVLTSPLVLAVTAAGNPDMRWIASGRAHSLALKPDGTLWAWGENYYGQLGDGTTNSSPIPIEVQNDVMAVAAGWEHSLALKFDGSLLAWGRNDYGQLGNGTTTTSTSAVLVPLTGVVAIAAGGRRSLALGTDGSLWQWGNGGLSPVLVLTDVKAIATGGEHSLAVKTDGSLWAWGNNGFGQLGDGTTTNQPRPVKIPLENVEAVAAGSRLYN